MVIGKISLDMTRISKKYIAAIFDLDGVIVNTAKYHYLAWKRLASELGFNFSNHDNEKLKGVSRMRSLDILLEIGKLDFDENTKSTLAEKKNRWYIGYIRKIDRSELLPGAKDCLIMLRKKGIKIALASASKNAVLILRKLKIKDLFDAIIDGNKVSKTKPDPEIFLLGAQELGVNPNDCVVFEDAESGIKAARSAGMYAVGVGKSNSLKDSDYIIKGLYNFDINKLF